MRVLLAKARKDQRVENASNETREGPENLWIALISICSAIICQSAIGKPTRKLTFKFIVGQRSLKVFFNLGRCVSSIMRENYAICVYILRSAFTVVRIFGWRSGRTYSWPTKTRQCMVWITNISTVESILQVDLWERLFKYKYVTTQFLLKTNKQFVRWTRYLNYIYHIVN